MEEVEKIFAELGEAKADIFRGKVKNFQSAEHDSSLKGPGYEIHSINQWRLGEPMANIDLQLSLRTWPKKIYRIDRIDTKNAPLILVADVSPSVLTKVDDVANKFHLLLHFVSFLGLAANHSHDPVGILCVSDKIEFYLSPKSGFGQLYYAVKLIIEKAEEFEKLKKKHKLIKRGSDLNSALAFLAARLHQQCSIVLLSDFMDAANGEPELNCKLIEFLSAKHNWNLVSVFLDDPEELRWLNRGGTVRLRDIETGLFRTVKLGRAREVRRLLVDKRNDLRKKLEKSGVDSVILSFGDHFNNMARFLMERGLAH